MKNLATRVVSGIIYVALIFFAVYTIPHTPVLFLVIFSMFTLIGMWEINRLTFDGGMRAPLLGIVDMIGGVGIFMAFFSMYAGADSRSVWLLPLLLYFIVRLVMQLWLPHVNAIHSIGRSMMGMVYVAFPLALANSVVALRGHMMLLAIFILIWVNDTGAYCFGCTLGKMGNHKLFERVSPHKSWEGFWGGIACAVAVSVLLGSFFNEFFAGPSLPVWIGLALVVAIASVIGDLVESLVKRTADVKDSSSLIPGHGGLLDRIDSFLMACPSAVAYFIVLKYC